ncbi:MAG: EscU/YscU/HrcU family type III secretion system export apparatus switch protein, partial [Mariprofundaceae bacterium]|nr:EscU/YscU/HrcU family type III secretion system export apparatus switch protein [Mariprofundaceae bacterium]
PSTAEQPSSEQAQSQQAAVALAYDHGMGGAPRVMAAGVGEIAKAILILAREHDVHIHNDAQLASLLAQVPVGQEIPEEAYQLVAELLSFLYQADQSLQQR